jgi:hypothetical protein
MDLLALSGGLVLAAAKRKAVRKWAGRRQFWACINSDFAALMGAVGSGGRLWQCHRREDALTGVVVLGVPGYKGAERLGGSEKCLDSSSSWGHRVDHKKTMCVG